MLFPYLKGTDRVLRAHSCLPNKEIALGFTKRWSLINRQGFSICQALTFGQAPPGGEPKCYYLIWKARKGSLRSSKRFKTGFRCVEIDVLKLIVHGNNVGPLVHCLDRN